MFCGDEVSAIVGDVGTDWSKFGYAGEDLPKAVLPSMVGFGSSSSCSSSSSSTTSSSSSSSSSAAAAAAAASSSSSSAASPSSSASSVPAGASAGVGAGGQHASAAAAAASLSIGTAALHCRRDGVELRGPTTDGLISDWEVTEKLWGYALDEMLHVDPREHPVLATEPSFNTRANREKYAELIFEKFQVPALYIAKSAVLSAFALGRATALVVDCGAATTSVTPVLDGYILRSAMCKSPLGGTYLTDQFGEMLRDSPAHKAACASIAPRYTVSRAAKLRSRKHGRDGDLKAASFTPAPPLLFPGTHPTYEAYMRRDVLRDMKETACVMPEVTLNEELAAKMPAVTYELPDGTVVQLGLERYKVPERLMAPVANAAAAPPGSGDELGGQQTGEGAEGSEGGATALHTMIHQSISKCHVDIRRDMCKSILLTGGGSLFHYMPERLNYELVQLVPASFKVQFLACEPTQRKFGSWMGGSILASLGSFQQMWLSKAEYLEHGADVVERRFL